MKSSVIKVLSEAAHRAALCEVMTSPKPGLVDAFGNGCHEDMDCKLFIKSAEAIAPFWMQQAQTGVARGEPARMMQELRAAGVQMERAMLCATGGVNTHKGLIYLLSLLVCGAAAAFSAGEYSPRLAASEAASLAAGSVERELAPLLTKPRARLSNGERLFVEHGVTGARGEAARGFPSVIDCGLPELRAALMRGAQLNDAGLSALLSVMGVCEDSNVMHRGGFEYWRNEYRADALAVRAAFDAGFCGYAPLYAMEARFLPRRISPGGAADLLSCVYFLNFCSDI